MAQEIESLSPTWIPDFSLTQTSHQRRLGHEPADGSFLFPAPKS